MLILMCFGIFILQRSNEFYNLPFAKNKNEN